MSEKSGAVLNNDCIIAQGSGSAQPNRSGSLRARSATLPC